MGTFYYFIILRIYICFPLLGYEPNMSPTSTTDINGMTSLYDETVDVVGLGEGDHMSRVI